MLVVQKYGGSSVADADRIMAVATRVARTREKADVAIVVSAMGKTTDNLIALAQQLSTAPDPREMDKLLATGEQASSALMTMALQSLGCKAVSLTGGQAGIITEVVHRKARISKIDPTRMRRELDKGNVLVIAGFQGITEHASWADITTLGRGGSDTTAVAVARALDADRCEIYTDVEGVYTTDPRIVPEARKLDSVSYEEMLELAGQGAKVMHSRAVELGELYDIEILVAHSQTEAPGTVIRHEDEQMEIRNPVRGIAHDAKTNRITVASVPDIPGAASRIFHALAEKNVSVDIIVQNVSSKGVTDLSFTVNDEDFGTALAVTTAVAKDLNAGEVTVDEDVAKVSIVGTGIRSHPGYADKMFSALAEAGINILSITTSEIRITVLINSDDIQQAVRVLHQAFELEKA
ncbi:MAG: aspartate kinase [Armatimonadetes bacterium]|nr:aspartate kinase [Armatimonadota bacterium]